MPKLFLANELFRYIMSVVCYFYAFMKLKKKWKGGTAL